MAESYADFIRKFAKTTKSEPTSDDCYTPPEIYDAVASWAVARFHLSGVPLVRPFYPGGDYERAEYPQDCVVLDNPPFSLMSQIVRFYSQRGIRFFLFCDGKTLFKPGIDGLTYVVVNAKIRYNGCADVRTGFVTNLDPDHRLILSGTLSAALRAASPKSCQPLPRLVYPSRVVTPTTLRKYVVLDQDIDIPASECSPVVPTFGGRHLVGGSIFLSEAQAERLRISRDSAAELHPTTEDALLFARLDKASTHPAGGRKKA